MFVVVVNSCIDCNGQAVGLFEKKPTKEQINELRMSIGGMWCVRSNIFEVDVNKISDEKEIQPN